VNSEEFDSLLTGIIRAEDRNRELPQAAPDAAGISDDVVAARKSLDTMLDRLCRQLSDYRLLAGAIRDVWQQIKEERRRMRQRIQQLEVELEKAKRDNKVMRDKLDGWCRARNREEEMVARRH
jgi:hypothetical protein